MKLLIAGSRKIKEFDLSPYVPKNTTLIISGGADGIDTLAEQYADTHNISKLILLPEWSVYGKTAALVRNKKMIDEAESVLVIWDGHSKGSKFTISYAKKQDKELRVITI